MSPEDMNELVDTHGAGVYRFCLRLTGSRQDAEELFQQTFLRAMELRSRIDPQRNPLGFLLAVAAKAHRRGVGKLSRRNRILPPAEHTQRGDPLDEAEDPCGVEQRAEQRELQRVLAEEVRRLPEKLRTPVLMHYVSGLTVEQIAETTGAFAGTVKSRLYQARQQIKRGLEAKGYAKEQLD